MLRNAAYDGDKLFQLALYPLPYAWRTLMTATAIFSFSRAHPDIFTTNQPYSLVE